MHPADYIYHVPLVSLPPPACACRLVTSEAQLQRQLGELQRQHEALVSVHETHLASLDQQRPAEEFLAHGELWAERALQAERGLMEQTLQAEQGLRNLREREALDPQRPARELLAQGELHKVEQELRAERALRAEQGLKELRERETRSKELTDEREARGKELDGLRGELEARSKEVKELRDEREVQSKEVERLREERDARSKELRAEREARSQQKASYVKLLDQSEADVDRYRGRCKDSEAEAKKLASQLAEAKERRTELVGKAAASEAELRAQLEAAQQQLAALSKEHGRVVEMRCACRGWYHPVRDRKAVPTLLWQ